MSIQSNTVMEMPKVATPNFGASPIHFLKEVKTELIKVKWPSQQEVVKLTTIVIIVSVAVGIFLSSLDFIFTKIMELVTK